MLTRQDSEAVISWLFIVTYDSDTCFIRTPIDVSNASFTIRKGEIQEGRSCDNACNCMYYRIYCTHGTYGTQQAYSCFARLTT